MGGLDWLQCCLQCLAGLAASGPSQAAWQLHLPCAALALSPGLFTCGHQATALLIAAFCLSQDLPRFKRTLLKAQYRVRALVTSSWFNNIFLLAILLNTVALAIVYDGMSPE